VWASVAGDRLYVATGDGITLDRLTVFDVSAPTSPRQLQQVDKPRLGDIALAAGAAYAVEEHGPVHVYGLQDGLLAAEIGGYALPRLDARDVVQSGGTAYVASAGTGVWILDISAPRRPSTVARHDCGAGCCATSVAVDPPHLYVMVATAWGGVCSQATAPYRLDVLDVGAPAVPRRIGSYSFPVEPESSGCWAAEDNLTIVGDRLYRARGGLQILDIADPTQPVPAGGLMGVRGGCDVAVRQGLAYLAVGRTDDAFKGLVVLDIADPAAIREVGRQAAHLVPNAYGAHRVEASAGRAYAMEQNAGVQVVDVSDPSRPAEVGFVGVGSWMSGIALRGDRLFVLGAYRPGSLLVYDLRDPRQVRLAGGHQLEALDPQAIEFSGDAILAAAGDDGLRVLEPLAPGADRADPGD
jgi:hypothetical protein